VMIAMLVAQLSAPLHPAHGKDYAWVLGVHLRGSRERTALLHTRRSLRLLPARSMTALRRCRRVWVCDTRLRRHMANHLGGLSSTPGISRTRRHWQRSPFLSSRRLRLSASSLSTSSNSLSRCGANIPPWCLGCSARFLLRSASYTYDCCVFRPRVVLRLLWYCVSSP